MELRSKTINKTFNSPEAVAPIAKVAAVPTVAPLPTAPTVAR